MDAGCFLCRLTASDLPPTVSTGPACAVTIVLGSSADAALSPVSGRAGIGGADMSRSTDRFRLDTMSYFLFAAVSPMALAMLRPEFERDMPLPCLLPVADSKARTRNSSSPRIWAWARAARQDSENTSCRPWSIAARDCMDTRCMRAGSIDMGEKNAFTEAVDERRLSAAEIVLDCEYGSFFSAIPSSLESVFEYLSLVGVLAGASPLGSLCFSSSERDWMVGRPVEKSCVSSAISAEEGVLSSDCRLDKGSFLHEDATESASWIAVSQIDFSCEHEAASSR